MKTADYRVVGGYDATDGRGEQVGRGVAEDFDELFAVSDGELDGEVV